MRTCAGRWRSGLAAALVMAAGSAACSAQCIMSWSGPHADSSIGSIYSMVPFRGPSGATDLYCGGSFRNAGAPGIDRFARWRATPTGSAFEAIPNGPSERINTTDIAVWTMIVYDLDGPGVMDPVLIVGGNFAKAGSEFVYSIAAWNGVTWSGLGSGFGAGIVLSLIAVEPGQGSLPPGLYAGGRFDHAGSEATNSIARWDGSQWRAVPGGVVSQGGPGGAQAMALYDPDAGGPEPASLYVTGWFDTAGGVPVHSIARWDGASWFPLEAGLGGYDGIGYALFAADLDGPGPQQPSLIVGGSFMQAGPIYTRDVARWDGAAWSALAAGLGTEHSQRVHQFLMFDPDGEGVEPAQLTAVGTFEPQVGGAPGWYARWTGGSWLPIAVGSSQLQPAFLSTHSGAAFDEDGAGPLPASLYTGGFRGLMRFGCRLCGANCDQSVIAPVLNVNDFTCFINAYAAGDPYANCDGSTTPPVLNVNDFTCFSNRYAAGCL